MIGRAASTGVPLSTIAVLMLSVFTVSMGYGVILPLLPFLIERLLGTGVDAAQLCRSASPLFAVTSVTALVKTSANEKSSFSMSTMAEIVAPLMTMLDFSRSRYSTLGHARCMTMAIGSDCVARCLVSSVSRLSPPWPRLRNGFPVRPLTS